MHWLNEKRCLPFYRWFSKSYCYCTFDAVDPENSNAHPCMACNPSMADRNVIYRAKLVYRNWSCYYMTLSQPFLVRRRRLNYCNCFRCDRLNCYPHCQCSVRNRQVFRSIFYPALTLPLWSKREKIPPFSSRTIRIWEMLVQVQLEISVLEISKNTIALPITHHFSPSLCQCCPLFPFGLQSIVAPCYQWENIFSDGTEKMPLAQTRTIRCEWAMYQIF